MPLIFWDCVLVAGAAALPVSTLDSQLTLSLGATLLLLTLGVFPPSKILSFDLGTEHLMRACTESSLLG